MEQHQDLKPGHLVLDSVFLTSLLILLVGLRDSDKFRKMQVAHSGQNEYWGKGGNKFRKVVERLQMIC